MGETCVVGASRASVGGKGLRLAAEKEGPTGSSRTPARTMPLSRSRPRSCSPSLLLVSWNVAGWNPTVTKLGVIYGGVSAWLGLLRPAILCLQETKVSSSKLADRGTASNFGASHREYDTFWCPCRHAGAGKRGMNGVATFALKGTVVAANARFLGEEFDVEGRCLVTEHSRSRAAWAAGFGFFVVNVYVPNAQGE